MGCCHSKHGEEAESAHPHPAEQYGRYERPFNFLSCMMKLTFTSLQNHRPTETQPSTTPPNEPPASSPQAIGIALSPSTAPELPAVQTDSISLSPTSLAPVAGPSSPPPTSQVSYDPIVRDFA